MASAGRIASSHLQAACKWLGFTDHEQKHAHTCINLGCLNPTEAVAALGADSLVGSSHTLRGPTDMGFLWAREALLEVMPPFLGGGEMMHEVYLDHSTWADLPHKFEAGTPAIGKAIGMGAALDDLQNLGLEHIHQRLIADCFEISDLQALKTSIGLSDQAVLSDEEVCQSFLDASQECFAWR